MDQRELPWKDVLTVVGCMSEITSPHGSPHLQLAERGQAGRERGGGGGGVVGRLRTGRKPGCRPPTPRLGIVRLRGGGMEITRRAPCC